MKKKNRKLTQKQNQRIKAFILALGFLISFCLVITISILLVNMNSEIYKVDSRVDQILSERKKENSESGFNTIAWLRVQGTNIDAPVVSFNTLVGFLAIDKENFLWNEHNSDKFYNQINISGHNLLNLSKHPQRNIEYFSRFDDLMSFVYDDFVEENKYIQYTVNGQDYVYKIFGVFFESEYNVNTDYKENFSEEQMKEYIEKVKELSVYDYDVDVNETDSVITLTTCTRMFSDGTNKQIFVVGRLLREDEKMENYEVIVNEKYKEIEKIVKGDVENAKEA